jgi:hypothetical protein
MIAITSNGNQAERRQRSCRDEVAADDPSRRIGGRQHERRPRFSMLKKNGRRSVGAMKSNSASLAAVSARDVADAIRCNRRRRRRPA